MKSKMKVFVGILFLCISVGMFISCNKKASNQGHVYTKFILGVQSRITVFGANEQKAKYIAEVFIRGSIPGAHCPSNKHKSSLFALS